MSLEPNAPDDEATAAKAPELTGTVTALGHLLFALIEETLPTADRARVVRKAIDRIGKISKPGTEHREAIASLQSYLDHIKPTGADTSNA